MVERGRAEILGPQPWAGVNEQLFCCYHSNLGAYNYDPISHMRSKRLTEVGDMCHTWHGPLIGIPACLTPKLVLLTITLPSTIALCCRVSVIRVCSHA